VAGFRRLQGPGAADLHARLHRGLHPHVVAGRDVLSVVEWRLHLARSATATIVRVLRSADGRRLTSAMLCERMGRSERDEKAEVSAALAKLLKQGRVVRRRGILAGVKGSWWYALAPGRWDV
jgi:hypothetical protein